MTGVPLKAVQELLGHSTIDMTMRYAHLSADVTREAVARLDGIDGFGGSATWGGQGASGGGFGGQGSQGSGMPGLGQPGSVIPLQGGHGE